MCVQCAMFIVDTYPDRPDGLRLAQAAGQSQVRTCVGACIMLASQADTERCLCSRSGRHHMMRIRVVMSVHL